MVETSYMMYGFVLMRSRMPLAPCAKARPPRLEGVRLVSRRGIGAVLGSPRSGPGSIRELQLIHQHRALEAMRGRYRAVVPIRPADRRCEEAQVVTMLEHNHQGIRDQLERFDGLVEASLVVELAAAPPPLGAATSGTEYLRRRLPGEGAVAAAGDAVRQLDRELARVAAERACDRRGSTLTLSYLMERERFAACRATFEERRAEEPAVRMRFNGPWVPYSFVRLFVAVPEAQAPARRVPRGVAPSIRLAPAT